MDLGVPLLIIKYLPESKPLKSRVLVREFAVRRLVQVHGRVPDQSSTSRTCPRPRARAWSRPKPRPRPRQDLDFGPVLERDLDHGVGQVLIRGLVPDRIQVRAHVGKHIKAPGRRSK